jgi:hypothetical protein
MQQLTTRSWRKLKSVLAPLPPRATNDYATHVPVLIGLASLRRIERVLEFGCGRYSTRTFLDRAAFPDLKELHSVENDPAWAKQIKTDARGKLHLTTGPISDMVSSFDLETFDLILVDDSKTAAERAATIRTLTVFHPSNPWLLIHDYEVDEYQRASDSFKQRFIFKAFNPQTGFVSNAGEEHELKAIDKQIKANRTRLEPDDVEGWVRVFRK